MKSKYIIGGIIIILFTIWAAVSFKSNLTPYVSIADAKKGQSVVQVKGERVDSGNYDVQKNVFMFKLRDDKGDVMQVVYGGAKPGNFEQANHVVCIGKYYNGSFHAESILVKCPSKYQKEGTQV